MDNVYCVVGSYEDLGPREDVVSVHRSEEGANAEAERQNERSRANDSLYNSFKVVVMPVRP